MPPLLQLLVLMVLVMLLQPRPLIRPGEGGWASLDCPTGPADQRLGSKMAIGRSGRGRATSPARCRRRRRLRRTPCHAMPCRAMWCAPVSCAARLGGIEARLGRPCTRYLGHDPTTPTSQCAALATLVPLEVVGGGPGRGLRHRARQPDCLLRVRQSCCCMDQAVRGSSGYEYEVAPCPARQGGDDTAPHRTALHHDAGADGLPRTGRLPFPTASTSPI